MELQATAPKGRARCQSRNRSGSQCRLHVHPPSDCFCSRHASGSSKIIDPHDDSLDLSDDIFADEEAVLAEVENINKVLTNVVTLLAEGRISTLRGAAISYALSLLLRTVVLMDQQAADEPMPVPVFWDDPRRKLDAPASLATPPPAANSDAMRQPAADSARHPESPANRPEPTPGERFEAFQRYQRMRT